MNDKDGETGANWSGKLLDTNGRQGTIEIELDSENKRSSWRLKLANRDGEPDEMKGETDVYFTGESMQMKSEQEVGKGEKIEWEIDLKPGPAGRYAKSAMVGQYAIRGASENFILSQGVMILWQFQ